jgi:hypothetical protein
MSAHVLAFCIVWHLEHCSCSMVFRLNVLVFLFILVNVSVYPCILFMSVAVPSSHNMNIAQYLASLTQPFGMRTHACSIYVVITCTDMPESLDF